MSSILGIVETAPVVLEIGAVLLVAASLGYLARRLRLPAMIGYLAAGLLVSFFSSYYSSDGATLSLLADVGVVLLLFEVGIEIDMRRLRREQAALLWTAPLQVLIGVAVGAPILGLLGFSTLAAVLLSLSLAMSSSVVIVNITRSRRRTTNPQTDAALLSWSVLQDITGVALTAVVLALNSADLSTAALSLLKLLGFAGLALVAAQLLPRLLRKVRWEHDMFLIYSVAVGLTIAAIGAVWFELPIALAAFVAGLAINQGRDADDVRRVLLPFRDLFAVLFFVVMGSLINPSQVVAALPTTFALLALLLLTKTLVVWVLMTYQRIPGRPLQAAIGLSQVGEFSFVLGSLALARGAIESTHFTALLLAVVFSIALSSVAVKYAAPHRHRD